VEGRIMKRLILIALLVLMPLILSAASVELTWTPNTDAVASYKVYQSFTDGVWGVSVATIIAPTAIYNSPQLTGGAYFFAVTALDKDGNESDKSVSVKAIIPLKAPVGLKAIIKN
jgi:fibronectin type 3 domain-containing protein